MRRLVPSPFLVATPELDDPGAEALITPESYSSLGNMLDDNPSVDTFNITAGDYRSWRTDDVSTWITGLSGTSSRRRVLRFYDSDGAPSHPVHRPGNEAVFLPLEFNGDSSYWLVHGLTFDLEGLEIPFAVGVRPGSERLVFDQCLVRNHYQGGITSFGSYNTVQRCVIRDAQINSGIDTFGVMVAPQQGTAVVGCRTLDCEIFNMVDMLAATVSSSPGDAYTEVGDYIIDGCDLYNTPAYIATGAMENIVDFKTGSDTKRNYLRNCRAWGLAEGSGGSGGSAHSFLFHRAARNWTIEDCIIGENASADAAYYESVWQTQDMEEGYVVADLFAERDIVFRRNIVYGCHAAFGATLDGQLSDNRVANCDRLFYKASDAGRQCPTDPVITGTRQRGVLSIFDPDDPENPPYTAADNAELPERHFYYERKRWTGPEIARAW